MTDGGEPGLPNSQGSEEPPATSDPVPSLRADFVVSINGWDNDDEGEARTFGQMLMELTRSYSRFLELGLLEQIVIAYDYHAALASVDCGRAHTPTEPTSNEFGQGGAMAVTVRHGEGVASVVVIWTPLVRELFAEGESEEKALAGHTFVHELIHVDDLAFMDRTFPGGALATWERDPCHGALLSIASPAYSEYSASRRLPSPNRTMVLSTSTCLKRASRTPCVMWPSSGVNTDFMEISMPSGTGPASVHGSSSRL